MRRLHEESFTLLHANCCGACANACVTPPAWGWLPHARAPCGNNSPYSPKCLGKSCPQINILPGAQGEFYISRFDNNGNAENAQVTPADAGNLPQAYTTNTAQRNYGENEFAEVYIPAQGWLTPIMMDVVVDDDGDTLQLLATPDDVAPRNLKFAAIGEYLDMWSSESMVVWQTDGYRTGKGWTLIFQPNYPEIELKTGTPMAQGANGYRIVNVYGSAEGANDFTGDYTSDSFGGTGDYVTEYSTVEARTADSML